MKKILTLAVATTLVTGLSAQAQITLDGTINANEIGTGAGKYVSLGAFTTPHVGNAGFGFFGLLRMYGANTGTKLYVGLAGSIEPGGNNFQLYLDLPGRTGVPVGTELPAIPTTATVFGTDPVDPNKRIGGTKMEMEVDAAIALTGSGDVQAAVYTSATAGVAKSVGGGAAVPADGSANPIPATETTGAYAPFAGTRVAYLGPTGNITTNPGNANAGGAGSLAVEFEFDRAALGLPTGASIVRLLAAYVSGDYFWSSDVIPEVPGNGNTNLGFKPDFTALAGTQAASFSVVLATRAADEAVVAMSVFPNPTQGQSTVSYRVLGPNQPVAVTVTDLVGRNARTLLNQPQAAGIHELTVNTGDLAAGTYLVKVRVGDRVAIRKLVLN
ncbi:T9SS type A sorting domain-containing protein [Hymenobacter sp.]|uniref:T9SS type A sorting domain-containing protein n=1 Tax=Hymenobacter sp. TaxID=1898978 RepID=UPI00286B71F0|nr:T9SS type A sorting domain-containing protein [Hymenobacter sp.]